EGQTDVDEKKEVKGRPVWARHAFSGPARDGTFADTKLPVKEQWMYHALADTMLANSLLRSLPEVDASKIGVMGVSWGGVITSTVIGLDERFAFGIPTYGCGHLFDAENHWGVALHDNEGYKQVWDGMNYADRVKMPVLWFSWPQDAHFPLGCQAENYRKAPGPHMVTLISKMGHSGPRPAHGDFDFQDGPQPPRRLESSRQLCFRQERGRNWHAVGQIDFGRHQG
ncbi:MAG: hypothetical protein EBS64_11200, partial [Verrucomicrobia bacterium]|nr:hypothetical protein [Verrucomicrobiota bacterium]